VIAAGGIFDGRGVASAFMLGASGVQIGTAFLRAPESAIPSPWKDALARTPDNCTKLTRAFSGRPARSIRNRMTEIPQIETLAAPFPAQRALVAPLAKAALAKGSVDFTSLWSGQAGLRARAAPSAEIFASIRDEALSLLA
jgi:nitronate monooxygenase